MLQQESFAKQMGLGGRQSPLTTTRLPCPVSLRAARWMDVLLFVKKQTRILPGTGAGSSSSAKGLTLFKFSEISDM